MMYWKHNFKAIISSPQHKLARNNNNNHRTLPQLIISLPKNIKKERHLVLTKISFRI